MSGARIRVLVAEDSLTVRRHLVAAFEADPGIEVVGEARDGRDAIELCERLRPDVVTMDMMMPGMSGVDATEHIMAYCPTPILIVSASTNRGELFRTYDALAAGAVDVLEKPRGDETDRGWERRLIAAVRLVSRIRVITHPRARLRRLERKEPEAAGPVSAEAPRVAALGASTGGPAALLAVLGALPRTFPLPILFVLHIAEPFGEALASWLQEHLAREVRYAVHGEALPPVDAGGPVLMAPPARHLEVASGRLLLSSGPERHSCRPSVDVLFESLAAEMGPATIAALLTGMGRDGAEGLLAIRRRGGLTIAQDEASSVVFGMPGRAVEIGAASRVLPLSEIGPALARRAARGGGEP